jgi:hypothetical protein
MRDRYGTEMTPVANGSQEGIVDPAAVKALARSKTAAAVETLASLMTDTATPPSTRVAAAMALLDRGWGKPATSVDVSVAKVDLTQMHLEALRTHAEMMRQHRAMDLVPISSSKPSD